MPDKEKLGLFLGGLAGGAIGVALIKKHLRDDEDRPVIVVSGGSIKIEHEEDEKEKDKKKWKKHDETNPSDRRWKPDHDNGRSVNIYVIEINVPGGHPRYAGDTVRFYFTPKVGIETTVTLTRELEGSKYVPLLDPSSRLDLRDERRLLILDVPGHISKLEIDNRQVATFPAGTEQAIKIKMW
jgi:hypothetical protein